MSTFWLWAPHAKEVAIEVAGRRIPLTPQPLGRWSADVAELQHGTDYGVLLDGEGPYPDPRSPWQPNGVLGLSRHVDHSRFVWSDADFRAPPLASGVLYELHIGTFTQAGTFDAAILRLPHLVSLGVTHVELMPVAEFPGQRGWGYDGVDLYAPHHTYGGPDGLKRLVDACHGHGLAVVLDVVYNHLGPSGNFLPKFGSYFTDQHRTPWGEAVNLDERGSHEVRRFFCDNALMWLRDYHIDGLRLDAVHAYHDKSAYPFLEQLALEVAALERQEQRVLVLIAESDLNTPRLVQATETGGFGLAAQWNDDFHHALHALLAGEQSGYYADFGDWATLAKAIQDGFVYDGQYSKFRQRHHGRPYGATPPSHLVVYLQNHDQIGNRAQGDRSSALLSAERLKAAAALIFCGPFLPMLFQGEEWAAATPFLYFCDHQDPKLAQAVSRGRRAEFTDLGWGPDDVPDPQAETTFAQSKLNWADLDDPNAQDLFQWHRSLICLRRATKRGEGLASVRYSAEEQWLFMTSGELGVAFSLSDQPVQITDVPASGDWEVALSHQALFASAKGLISLQPHGTLVLKRKRSARA